jgi:DNA repair exonuclease SbcCD ATPase subunit
MATTTQPQRKMNLDLQSQPQVSEAPQDKPSEDLLDEIKKAEAQRLAKRVEQEQQALALALAQQKAELEAEKKRLEEEKRILKAQAEAQQQAAARAAKEAEAKRQAELKRQQEESARIAEAKRLAEEKQRAEQKQKQKQQEQKALELALAQQQAAERAAKEAEAKRQAEKEAAEKREREHAAKARLVKDTAAFLKEYVKRYNEGDLDAFIALFTEDARMNHAKGKAAIQKAYVKLFDSTTNRDLKITVMAIQPSDNGADVEVSYVLTYLNSSSSNERLTGEIKFELKAGEEGSKIMSQRF